MNVQVFFGISLLAAIVPATAFASEYAHAASRSHNDVAAQRSVHDSIKNYSFSPKTIKVRVGQTVVWTNMDQVQHTVTADKGSVASPSLARGEQFHLRFTKVGTYHFHCAYHPFMQVTVKVVK